MFSPKTAKQIAYFTVNDRVKEWGGFKTTIVIHFHPWWKLRRRIVFDWICQGGSSYLKPLREITEITDELQKAIELQS